MNEWVLDSCYNVEESVEREVYDYVHMNLLNGDSVKFKRVWGGHVFTDEELELLMGGYEIVIDTPSTRGIRGSLDWDEYNGQEYFGFIPWGAEGYTRENAPFPVRWGNHVFTKEEERRLRNGQKVLLLIESHRSGSSYGVHVSFNIIRQPDGDNRWGIIPHFEEFDMPIREFTRETCVFTPCFDGYVLSQEEIDLVRRGEGLYYEGISSRNGRSYKCLLYLRCDGKRWRLVPQFID